MGNITHAVRALAKIEGEKVTLVIKRYENDTRNENAWGIITGTLTYSDMTSEWQVSTHDAFLNFQSSEVISVDDNRLKQAPPLICIFWGK